MTQASGSEGLVAVRQVVDGMRRSDHGLGLGLGSGLGPSAGLTALLGQAELAESLVTSTTGELHKAVLSTLGEIHQLAGWMRFDQGDTEGAALSFRFARAFAERADNAALVAYILGPSQGFAETYRGDPAGGARSSSEALIWARRAGNARLTAFVMTTGARAQARMGERQRCLEMLELAGRQLARHEPREPDPLWLEVFDEAALRGHAGSCLLDLGQPRRAIAPLARQDAAAPKLFRRNRVMWLLDRARAHLKLTELEEASAIIGRALDVAERTSSRRTLVRFEAIAEELRPSTSQPQVAEVHDRLRQLKDAQPLEDTHPAGH